MLELEFTPSTVIILLVIAALAFLAVRRLVRKGMCDCHDDKGCSGCSGCAKGAPAGGKAAAADLGSRQGGCSAVDKMVERMNRL